MTLTIIGAGATGILTAHFLKSKFNFKTPIKIIDKSNRIGGRMASTRFKTGVNNQTGQAKYSYLDFGLQYLSFNKNNLSEIQKEVVERLEKDGVLQKFIMPETAKEPNVYKAEEYLRPKRNSDILDYFYENLSGDASIEFEFGKRVLELSEFSDSSTYKSKLLLTIPTKQVLEVKDKKNSGSNIFHSNNQLNKVNYLARYCHGMIISKKFYESSIKSHPNYSEYRYFSKEEQANTDSDLAYFRFKNFEHNNDYDHIGVVLHGKAFICDAVDTTVDRNKAMEMAGVQLETNFLNHFGLIRENLSESAKDRIATKSHRWLYCKPVKARGRHDDEKMIEKEQEGNNEIFGQNFINIDENIMISGEAFAKEANFLGCIDVAYETAREISG